jgi:hypothetical protein
VDKLKKIFESLPQIIQLRLMLALLAATIPDLASKWLHQNQVIAKLTQDELLKLISHCEQNLPEYKSILIAATKTGYAALFALIDQLPVFERAQVIEALNAIPEQTRLHIIAYLKKLHNNSVTENKQLSYHALSMHWNVKSLPPAKMLKVMGGNTIVVMTNLFGGFGDFFAAKRLIVALKARSAALRIIWIIIQKNKVIPKEAVPSDENHVFSNWDELFESPQIAAVYGAAVAFEYPAGIQPCDKRFEKISRLRQQVGLRPVLHVFEYDCIAGFAGERSLHTGFGPNALGVFLGEPLSRSDGFLTKAIKVHSGIAQLFSNQSLEEYRQTHVCYFGYDCKDIASVTNGINSYCFIAAVISLQTRKNNNKNIDIITPFSIHEQAMLITKTKLEFLRKNGVAKIHFISSEGASEVIVPGSDPQGKVVRVSNFFPFPNDLFKALINFVERDLIMCTGDLSLSDVLEVPGAIPLYQIMGWKEELYKQFCTLARKVCGDDVELTNFLSSLYKPFNPEGDDFPEWIAFCIAKHGEQMRQQMLQLQQYLKEHKNLFDTLPSLIIAMVDELKTTRESTSTEIATVDAYTAGLGLKQ